MSAMAEFDLFSPQDLYTVSRLNREVRSVLSSNFALLWIEGELSNAAQPRSGHLYFTLKDAEAQVRCVMFRSRNVHLDFAPKDGIHVVMRARVGLYEPRGEFQLTVEHMEQAGSGALQRTFEVLKAKLAAEGLFDASRKQELPPFPKCLGVITSSSGAAIRDILSVLRRRFPALPIVIYPAPVQGEGAGDAIVGALRIAEQRGECDVLILARGGGSLEDLWAFNEEAVARAIAACHLPVVTGVGHEIDFTIADFAADRRASTPSAAAELISPDRDELLASLKQVTFRLRRWWREAIASRSHTVNALAHRLAQQHPIQRLQQQSQRVDHLEQRLGLAMRLVVRSGLERVAALHGELQRHAPTVRLARVCGAHEEIHRRLLAAMHHQLHTHARQLDALTKLLNTVSPLATLERGYAIVTRADDDAVVRSHHDVQTGTPVRIRLAKDRLAAKVTGWEDE